jgi:hypothetical protein
MEKTMREFYTAVNNMRQYQKLYYGTPREDKETKKEYLIKSKVQEKVVDKMLAEMFFDNDEMRLSMLIERRYDEI